MPITARENEMPTTREICTQIFNDHQFAKQFGTVELMQLAYEAGRFAAFGEAKAIAAKTTTKPEPTVMDLADEFMDAVNEYDRSAIVSNSNGYVMRKGER